MANNEGNTIQSENNIYLFVKLKYQGHSFDFERNDRLDIGKSLFGQDSSIYRAHCSVIRDEEIVYIVALQQPSRVLINGLQIPCRRKVILDEKDQVKVGETTLHFKTIKKNTTNETLELKKGSIKKKKLKKESSSSEIINEDIVSPHAYLRIYALFMDTLIAFSLRTYLNSVNEFRQYFQSLTSKITPDILKDFSSFITAVISTAVILFAMRLISSLLLKRSLNQFLVGIKVKGGRFTSILRELLGIPMLALQLPLWPSLFSKRTLNEVLSKNCLISPKTTRLLAGFVLSILSTIILFLYLPYLVQFNSNQYKVNIIDKETSNYMQYSKSQKLSFDPKLKINIHSSKKIVNDRSINIPWLRLKDGNREYDLKRLKEFNWKNLMSRVVLKNPLFRLQYPSVYRFFSQKRAMNTIYKEEADLKQIESIKKFLVNSFSMSLFSPIQNLISNGDFFPASSSYFKNSILNEFEDSIDEINLIQSSNGLIIAGKSEKEIRFTPISYEAVSTFLVNGPAPLDHFFNISYYGNLSKKKLKKNGSFLIIDVFDFMNNFSFKETSLQRNGFEKVYGHFYNRAKVLVKSNESDDSFLYELNVVVDFFEERSNGNKIISQFVQEILLIEKALKFKQNEFFN